MAFKCTFVVSTIVVKCSNKAAGSGAGMNGEQTDSTEIHLGQGEDGKRDSLTDLFFLEGRSRRRTNTKLQTDKDTSGKTSELQIATIRHGTESGPVK